MDILFDSSGRTCWLCASLLFAAGLFGAGNARAVVIDDFTVGPQSVQAQSETMEFSHPGLSTANVLGGRRGVILQSSSGDSSLQIDTSNDGKAVLAVTSGWGYLTLSYGSEDDPLNLNLAALGHDAIRLRYRLTGIGEFTYIPAWYRVYGTGSQISIAITDTPSQDIIEVISPIPASNDLTDIDQITLQTIRVPTGTTLELIDIVTVPEPSLAVALLLPVLLRSRRRI